MKKCEYLDIGIAENITDTKTLVSEIEKFDKHDDMALPGFVKEIPTDVKRNESGGTDTVTIDYKWESASEGNIKIKRLVFRKGEPFEGLYRINIDKEESTFSLEQKGAIYIFRKTSEDVADALFEAARSVKTCAEDIVGYIKTVLGNVYMIAKTIKGSWTFDRELANGEIKHIDHDKLTEQQKRRLFDLIIEGLVELNASKLLLKDFSLNNVMLTNKSLVFTDLRNLRAARKKGSLVEEFRKTLRYLIAQGFGAKEDAYKAAAYYCAALSDTCDAWYYEKTGTKPSDSYEVAVTLERAVC